MNPKEKLEQIIRAYSNDLYRILYVYCKNKSDCEEHTEDTYQFTNLLNVHEVDYLLINGEKVTVE